MERPFEGEREAHLYKRYRSCTHPKVVERIMKYARESCTEPFKMVVDVGCGNGQHTLAFSPFAEKVLGTDVSPNMISVVANDQSLPKNVSFLVSPAEKLHVPDISVDMVTGAQCYHWFNHQEFHQEMSRVLKPNGVVAIMGHELEIIADPTNENKSKELLSVINVFFKKLSPYFQKALLPIFDHYANLSFPYKDVVREADICCDYPTVLADYLGVLDTFSQVQKWKTERPEEAKAAKDQLTEDLMKILGAANEKNLDEIPITLRLKAFLLLGRKN